MESITEKTQPDLFLNVNSITKENLGDALQQAIEIEIATIPTYLFTYYSINRTPDQESIFAPLKQALMNKGMQEKEAHDMALNFSADIMVFANKAGALIMSVAIEEMLHMSLSSNLKQALAGLPELVGKSPVFPTTLPGHIPPFTIYRTKLTQEQLITFLKIESPTALPLNLKAQKEPIAYKTIGEFYDEIKEFIKTNDLKYMTFTPQLIPGKGYYGQNNIDTIYYNKEHKPRLVNAPDSGDLVHVTNRDTAIQAIEIIVDQGEGNQKVPGLIFKDGKAIVNCEIYKGDYDDKNMQEISHFEKFSRIYCQYAELSARFAALGLDPAIDFSNYFVLNFKTDVTTAEYPANLQLISNLINAVYTYIFVMTEGCYKHSGNTQYEIFMFGIHKSMIFILNSLCSDFTAKTFTASDGKTYQCAPTFEDYPFDLHALTSPFPTPVSPKQQLISLYNSALAVFPTLGYLAQRFQDLPDVAL